MDLSEYFFAKSYYSFMGCLGGISASLESHTDEYLDLIRCRD